MRGSDHGGRFLLGLPHHGGGFGLRVIDDLVGGLLRGQQDTLQRTVGIVQAARFAGRLAPRLLECSLQPGLKLPDRGADLLEKRVDLVGVVTPDLLAELDVLENLRCQIHIRQC